MEVDQVQQWLPDPAGKHQFRLHSDGRPTEWVSDDGSMTVDRLEPAPADGAAAGVASVQPGSTTWGSASNSQPPAPAATAPVRPAGWYRNASNPSEVRYWDGSQWAVDQTVATATPSPTPAAPAGSLAGTGPGATLAPTAPGATTGYAEDAPGRHSVGRGGPAATDLPAVDQTANSVWAQPETGAGLAVAPPPATAPQPTAPAPSAALPTTPLSVTPADWYPDPSNRTRLRYWDGAGWTDHVLDEAPSHRPPA